MSSSLVCGCLNVCVETLPGRQAESSLALRDLLTEEEAEAELFAHPLHFPSHTVPLRDAGTPCVVARVPEKKERPEGDRSLESWDALSKNSAGVSIKEKLPMLVERHAVGRWSIRRCLLCGTVTYATAPNSDYVLVTRKLIGDQSVIDDLRASPDVSSVFGVILPKKETIPLLIDTHGFSNICCDTQLDAGSGSSHNTYYKAAAQKVQAMVSDYFKLEQEAMEERIRVYIDAQNEAFDDLKAKAKTHKLLVLNILKHMCDTQVNNEDESDSALPLSPFSMNSADPSPGQISQTHMFPYFAAKLDGSQTAGDWLNQNSKLGVGLNRPKAFSNPPAMNNWKRKRHSGGSGSSEGRGRMAKSRGGMGTAQLESQEEELFTFEDEDPLGNSINGPPFLSSDDEAETDDSGTAEDMYRCNQRNKRVPPTRGRHPAEGPLAQYAKAAAQARQSGRDVRAVLPGGLPRDIVADSRGRVTLPPNVKPEPDELADQMVPYGASLPVNIPFRTAIGSKMIPTSERRGSDESGSGGESGDDEEEEAVYKPEHGVAMAESMKAMALAIQNEDNPERLFGDRPSRRRYKTGDLVPVQMTADV